MVVCGQRWTEANTFVIVVVLLASKEKSRLLLEALQFINHEILPSDCYPSRSSTAVQFDVGVAIA
jgi:hypothetical protein